jgi:hypothetical protein
MAEALERENRIGIFSCGVPQIEELRAFAIERKRILLQ